MAAKIRSLVVKIGADITNLEAALKRGVTSTQGLEQELAKLGDKGVAEKAAADLQRLQTTIKQVTGQQQASVQAAQLAARGIEFMGGTARLTSTQLGQMERVLREGLDAARALGQGAPKELQKVTDAVAQQRKALEQASQGGLLGKAGGLLGSLGLDVGSLGAVGAVTAIAGTLISSSKAALEYADSLTKLSDQTSINVEALQRLDAIAEPSGNNLEQVANAVSKFQKNLATGNTEAVGALDQLGLSINQLRNLSPDQQFVAIAKAIQQIKDPAEQAAIAMALFGKGGAEILPTLKADVDALKDSTIVMSERATKALDDAGDAWDRFWRSARGATGEGLGQIAAAIDEQLAKVRAAEEQARRDTAIEGLGEQGQKPPVIFAPETFGAGGFDLAAKIAQTDAALRQLGQTAPTVQKEVTDVFDAIKKLLDETRAELFGTKLTERAELYAKALGDIGNVSKLTVTQQDSLLKSAKDAVAVYQAMGQRVPSAIRDIVSALQAEASARAIEANSINQSLPLYGANQLSWTQMMNIAKGLTADGLIPLAKGFDDTGRAALASADLAARAAERLKNFQKFLITPIALPSGSQRTSLQEALDEEKGVDATKEWIKGLGELSTAFSQLAQVSDGQLGQVVRQIGNVVSAMDLAVKAADTFGKSKGFGKVAAGAAEIAAIAQAGASGGVSGILSGALTGFAVGGVGGAIAGTAIAVFQTISQEDSPAHKAAQRAGFSLGRRSLTGSESRSTGTRSASNCA
jgi:hypothetical protein